MAERKYVSNPRLDRLLGNFGENIKLARLRRKLSAEMVAERAGISRVTLGRIENGAGSVAMGLYVQVLLVLGLEQDLLLLAADDKLGRKLQDANLTVKERAPKRKKDG